MTGIQDIKNTGWVRRSLVKRVNNITPKLNEIAGDTKVSIELGRAGKKGLTDSLIGKIAPNDEFIWFRVHNPSNDRIVGYGTAKDDFTEISIIKGLRDALGHLNKKTEAKKTAMRSPFSAIG